MALLLGLFLVFVGILLLVAGTTGVGIVVLVVGAAVVVALFTGVIG